MAAAGRRRRAFTPAWKKIAAVAEKELQWSLTANAGVQYDFTRRTALYFEPGVSYYLTETALRTARTVSPVNLSLQLGVRLTY